MTSWQFCYIKTQADQLHSLHRIRKMIKIICTILILRMHFACAQIHEDSTFQPPSTTHRPRPTDPVSTFLSGLGNLILDIDGTFSKQLAPKVDAEDRVKEQMYGRPRSGASYFNRIRENYRDIQKRLGESLGMADLRMSSGLGSVNVQTKGPKSLVDVSLPFLPMKLVVSSNQGVKTSDNVDGVTEATIIPPEQILPRIRSNFKLGNTEIKVDSKLDSLEPSELLKDVENQIKKALEDMRLTNGKIDGVQEEKLDSGLKPENELNPEPKEFSSRSGSEFEDSEQLQEDDSSPESRILGDVLYSESTFDKLTKRVMKDAKWAIDPKLFPSRAVETLKQFSNKAAESIIRPDIVKGKNPEKPEEASVSKIQQQQQKQDFKRRKSLKPLSNDLETEFDGEKINFIPQPDTNFKFGIKNSQRQKDSIILAFTPDGVPLKLRMAPEITNPIKFLHKALGTYGVSLNVPVASYDDIEPVGREILQLGTGSGGTMFRALYIDLSDSFQLESLLRTLRSTKTLQETETEGTEQEGF